MFQYAIRMSLNELNAGCFSLATASLLYFHTVVSTPTNVTKGKMLGAGAVGKVSDTVILI